MDYGDGYIMATDTMLRHTIYPALILIGIASAWERPIQAQQPEAEGRAKIATLIERLGADAFSTREQASIDLLEIGLPALVQLRAVTDSAPLEVQSRVQVILNLIETEKFNELSRSFLLDLDDANSYGLPAWDVYREIVGATRTSKLLFLEMIRQQPELAQLVDRVSQRGSTPPEVERAEEEMVLAASQQAMLIRESLYSLLDPEIGDAVSMLLVAAVIENRVPVEISDVIMINERRSFGGRIQKPGYSNCLKKLLGEWLPKTHDAMAPSALVMSLNYDLPEGAVIARRHLTNNFDNETRKWALHCLARFGTDSDVAILRPLLDDQTVVDEFLLPNEAFSGDNGIHESNSSPPGIFENDSAPVDNNMVVRINDMALATIMLLLGEKPAEIFPRFEPHSQHGFFVHSLASRSSEREQRAQKIQSWKKQHQLSQGNG
jgi:hypothetical protein